MASSDIWANFRRDQTLDQTAAWRSACLEVLRLSNLFVADTYRSRRETPPGVDPLADYHDFGWRDGHFPNPYFDPSWYRAQNPDVAADDTDPLLHYVSYGEREGRRPIAWFDPAWYRHRFDVPDHLHCLRHFLQHRTRGDVSPIPEFDSAWYLARYPDIAAAQMDPMEHYLIQGFREGRDPSPAFDTRYYRMRYLRGQRDQNPLLHFLHHRGQPGIHPRLPAGETTIPREYATFAAPGRGFEPVQSLSVHVQPSVLVLAFYLPQFHRIAQNDAWWGTGFTEWTNVSRALPRFAGHYQPRIPRDLGHYRLDDPTIMHQQVDLARNAGLGGFVFYFYWFDGQRLLEQPVERFLATPEIEFQFCLMWANENWTRRWDGSEEDILVAQSYRDADEAALIACFARHFDDPRYIRLHGRPVLMIYRAGLIPNAVETLARWRQRFRDLHGEDPILVMAQSFDDEDPRTHGLDGAVEFPPHKLVRNLTEISESLDLLDHEFAAKVYHYDDVVDASCRPVGVSFPLIRTVMPGWDNDARRQGRGMVIHGATPARYENWLASVLGDALARPFFGTPIACINAWNEWAEGAYLEPDQHWGGAFLNATGRAIRQAPEQSAGKLLLIGHDAFAAGAQLLLLHVARHLRAANGACIEIILCGGGVLEAQYRAVAPVHIVLDRMQLAEQLTRVRDAGFSRPIVNSAAACWCCPVLHDHGIAATLLVHEMPALMRARGLLAPLRAALDTVTTTVFAADAVREAVCAAASFDASATMVLPQGVYETIALDPAGSSRLRAEWAVAPTDVLVVGMGYADLRKGFDLFVEIVGVLTSRATNVHMRWVGELDPSLRIRLRAEIARAEGSGRFELVGWRDDPQVVLGAADCLLLTSREDPYPSVALEALHLGTPVIAFEGSGGVPDLLRSSTAAGHVIPMADCGAMASAIAGLTPVQARTPLLPGHAFAPYVAELIRLAWPGYPRVSVVVSCFGHAKLLPRRLQSIFGQTVMVHEVTVRDDASDDGSVAAASAYARDAGRMLDIVVAAQNSGSPFGCWHDAVSRASGELIWIAEADDMCEATFLARVVPTFGDSSVHMAFVDSVPVDLDGHPSGVQYAQSYAEVAGPGALTCNAVFGAEAFVRDYLAERNILFNVSAVVWRRSVLLAALDRLGETLMHWQVAGDWRLYVEVLLGQTGKVAYIAQPLNLHCRAPGTASTRVPASQHLAEIRQMQTLVRDRLGDPPGLAARQARYVRAAEVALAEAGIRRAKRSDRRPANRKTPVTGAGD